MNEPTLGFGLILVAVLVVISVGTDMMMLLGRSSQLRWDGDDSPEIDEVCRLKALDDGSTWMGLSDQYLASERHGFRRESDGDAMGLRCIYFVGVSLAKTPFPV